MSRDFPERDWKVLRELEPLALARFCDRVFADVERLISDKTRGSHERYGKLFKLIRERDRTLADTFDNLRRSTAFLQLTAMCNQELITPEEFARFSDKTREDVEQLRAITRGR